MIVLDGAMGTELEGRGVALTLPGWSGHAISEAPGVVRAVHAEYAAAGAGVHRANSWRCRRGPFPADWAWRARRAVELCRDGAGKGARVLGSFGPIEDCYRPDLSPGAAGRDLHREFVCALAEAGPDALIGETFAHVDEGLTALEEALRTGLPSWISFTPGFRGDLLTPDEMRQAARRAAAMGAAAVLVNCVPVERGVEYVDALAAGCAGRIPIGICANVWSEHSERTGGTRSRVEPERYADFAAEWSTRGATIVGGCCGTGSAHIAALAARFCA